MKPFAVILKSIVYNPYFGLCVGVLVAVSGAFELIFIEEEVAEESRMGHLGVLALSLFIVTKGVAHLLESLDIAGESLERMNFTNKNTYFFKVIKRYLQNPLFHFTIALLVLICGIFETWEWAAVEGHHVSAWHFGLVAVGFSMLAKPLSEFMDAVIFYQKAIGGQPKRSLLLRKISSYIMNPKFEMALAFFLIAISAYEEIVIHLQLVREGWLQPHHGLLFFGFAQAARAGAALSTPIDIIADAMEIDNGDRL